MSYSDAPCLGDIRTCRFCGVLMDVHRVVPYVVHGSLEKFKCPLCKMENENTMENL